VSLEVGSVLEQPAVLHRERGRKSLPLVAGGEPRADPAPSVGLVREPRQDADGGGADVFVVVHGRREQRLERGREGAGGDRLRRRASNGRVLVAEAGEQCGTLALVEVVRWERASATLRSCRSSARGLTARR
jgi:hypothetical protein